MSESAPGGEAKDLLFSGTIESWPIGYEGVNELAELLGVEPGTGSILIVGKGGKSYSLTDLLLAHVRLVLATRNEAPND